jgi:hypothetical protein
MNIDADSLRRPFFTLSPFTPSMDLSPIAQEAQQAVNLLKGYSFDVGWHSVEGVVLNWIDTYRATWVRDAVIEALYQGRYKAVSVQQILVMWQRRGQPIKHFTAEFEQVICRQIGIQLMSWSIEEGRSPQNAATGMETESDQNHLNNAATANAAVEDNGVLYTTREPIQTFQPELPFYKDRRR